jgi:Transposase DDE domain
MPEEIPKMSIVTQVAQAMQDVLTETAEQAGRASGFVQRASKLNGAVFAQTLTFGWMANPEASLDELTQTAAQCGVTISPQGLDQRFTAAAAECLKQVLEAAVARVVRSEPAALPLLERFTGVYLHDSTGLPLPDELKALWQGCGGSTASRAALKLQVRWELRSGQLEGPFLHPGYENDPGSEVQQLPIPAGALRLADLGYWSVERFAQIGAADGYWLSRLQAGTQVFTRDGLAWEVVPLLEAQKSDRVERLIALSAAHRLPCRLLAERVPPQVSAQRRRKLWQAAQKKGRTPSAKQLAMADWTILVTNVPAELLTLAEALVLAGVRWQIELLFKLWKSDGQIDQSRSEKPYRILCEVYAKLVGMVIQHWIVLTGQWRYPERSLRKAVTTVRKYAWQMAALLGQVAELSAVLGQIGRVLASGCRINKRRQRPATFQRLEQCRAAGRS